MQFVIEITQNLKEKKSKFLEFSFEFEFLPNSESLLHFLLSLFGFPFSSAQSAFSPPPSSPVLPTPCLAATRHPRTASPSHPVRSRQPPLVPCYLPHHLAHAITLSRQCCSASVLRPRQTPRRHRQLLDDPHTPAALTSMCTRTSGTNPLPRRHPAASLPPRSAEPAQPSTPPPRATLPWLGHWCH